MNSLTHLLTYLEDLRVQSMPCVLATILHTEGTSYQKASARMLLTADGNFSGLLSGGCLEGDLLEHAKLVLQTKTSRIVEYDMRSDDDLVWGLGSGCNGAITILLQPLSEANQYAPLASITTLRRQNKRLVLATVLPHEETNTGSQNNELENCYGLYVQTEWTDGSFSSEWEAELNEICQDVMETGKARIATISLGHKTHRVFLDRIDPAPSLLILGGGPDALPVVQFANELGWSVCVADHRPAYANPERFPVATDVVNAPAQQLIQHVSLDSFSATVVMSHHFDTDGLYLKHLLPSSIPYVGLLGPTIRRDKLFKTIGMDSGAFGNRLYNPVGLDIGGKTPEAIALSILAEIQAFFSGKSIAVRTQ